MREIHYDEFDAYESVIDSEYFGLPSAKVAIHKACESTKRQTDLFKFLQDFRFSIITNEGNNPINNQWLGRTTKAFLTDINFQFKKKVTGDKETLKFRQLLLMISRRMSKLFRLLKLHFFTLIF